MSWIKELKYAFYILIHPFDGFYDLRHAKKGSMQSATVLFALFAISVLVKRQLTGYLFNPYDVKEINYLVEVALAILPYVLWCAANWCVTSLMDGEGRFVDIVIAVGFSLTPFTILNILSVLVSQMVTLEESSIYTIIITCAILYSYALVFIGMMITHQYTLMKSMLTAIITLVGMCVILFLSFLVFYLIQQLWNFVMEVWSEASFRLNE